VYIQQNIRLDKKSKMSQHPVFTTVTLRTDQEVGAFEDVFKINGFDARHNVPFVERATNPTKNEFLCRIESNVKLMAGQQVSAQIKGLAKFGHNVKIPFLYNYATTNLHTEYLLANGAY
jgi:hypothetical protein